MAEISGKPPWLKIRFRENDRSRRIASMMNGGLHSVCQGAHCPNRMECWSKGTATFMVLGSHCTRNCRFCAVPNSSSPSQPDCDEPIELARSIKRLGLDYAVITSVTRDDLEDGGASHFAKCIRKIKKENKGILIEALIPDFNLNGKALSVLASASPNVISHNIETVRRLTPLVRDARAGYEKSLSFLSMIKDIDDKIVLKSGIMLGMGETKEEVVRSMQELRNRGASIITLGQYLRPSEKHFPVERYVTPDEFSWYESQGYSMGYRFVASGPLVRSSYRASEPFLGNGKKKKTSR